LLKLLVLSFVTWSHDGNFTQNFISCSEEYGNAIIWVVFVAAAVKLQQFVISEPNAVHHQSRVSIQQLTASVDSRKLVVTTYFMMSVLCRS